MGKEARRARRKERQETGGGGGSAQAGGTAASVVGEWRGVRTAAQQPEGTMAICSLSHLIVCVRLSNPLYAGRWEYSSERLFVESLRFGTQSPASLPKGFIPLLFLCCPYKCVASSGQEVPRYALIRSE